MKLLVLSFVAMFSMNTFALTNEQVKAIVDRAASLEEPNSDLKVLKVESSLNPVIGLGQINDRLFVEQSDFEFKYITFRLQTSTGSEDVTVISRCLAHVSVSKDKIAFVDVRGCKSKDETFGHFPENIDIEGINVSDLL